MRLPAARRLEEPTRLRPVELTASPSRDLSLSQYRILLAGAVLVGVLVRVMAVATSAFPLNDGGMFYAMTRDIQASSYHLPAFTSYNSEHIAFFYPPLGFYLAAVVNDLTPLGLVQVFRVLPLTFSILTVLAFVLLARDLLSSRLATVIAVFLFGVLPPTYYWMVMGGGLTRALGFLFAILSIRAMLRMYRQPSARSVVTCAALLALTLVSHIEMAWLAGLVSCALLVGEGVTRSRVLRAAAAVAGAVALSSPWWITVIGQHGVRPMFAAIASAGSSPFGPLVVLAEFNVPVQPLVDLIGGLALLGVVVCIRRRAYALPAWLGAVAIFDQRAFFTSTAMAIAMLAAIAITDLVLPWLEGDDRHPAREAAVGKTGATVPRWLPIAVVAVALGLPALGAIINSRDLRGLTPAEVDAMTWVRTNTPASSTFALVTNRTWPEDRNAEWFPAIAQRQSVATVQGSEWLPDDGFAALRTSYIGLQDCANSDGDCLQRWMQSDGTPVDYVYVLRAAAAPHHGAIGRDECCLDLRLALESDPRYTLVYDGAGAAIFKRR